MTTIRVSATKARNNFFSLLDQVIQGVQVIIEKDKKEVAVMSQKKTETNWEALMKATKESAGILKDEDLEDIYNNPARKPASSFLGKWDKGLKIKKK